MKNLSEKNFYCWLKSKLIGVVSKFPMCINVNKQYLNTTKIKSTIVFERIQSFYNLLDTVLGYGSEQCFRWNLELLKCVIV